MTTAQHLTAMLAAKMGLLPSEAVALPETITVAARKVAMTEGSFIAECLCNEPLRIYLASICRKVS